MIIDSAISFPIIRRVSQCPLLSRLLSRRIDRSIDTIRRYHVKEDIESVMETVAPDGEPIDHFDGRTLNPGHAIKGAWFIMWEGRHRDESELIELDCRMLDWMWQRGWDAEYGGMLYFVDVNGLPVQEYWHDMKFWWPHNETLIATLLAWSLTGDTKYADWHTQIHDGPTGTSLILSLASGSATSTATAALAFP